MGKKYSAGDSFHMKYILLVHHNEEVLAAISETTMQQMRRESVELTHRLHAKGQYYDAAPLQSASTATTVRVRDGKQFVTDGPFAETREQLGGYFLIEADGLEQAIAVAAQIPGARIGAIEIRPVVEVPGLPEK